MGLLMEVVVGPSDEMVVLSADVGWERFVPVGSALGVRMGTLAVMCLCWSCRARGAGTLVVTGRVMLKDVQTLCQQMDEE